MYLNECIDKDIKLSWFHAALVLAGKIGIGSAKANNELRSLLEKSDLESLYEHYFGMFPIDVELDTKLDKAYEKVNFRFKAITINDAEYPEKLRQIDGAAPVLYCRGDVGLLHLDKTISFVGTRELIDPVHIKHGESVIERLISAGYQAVVSGLARGSDTLGHEVAIRCGAKTIAVLGTPLDVFYPSENKNLQECIGNNHLLVSEYPIGLRPFGSYFANRNRTTVGLSSHGVVVARAGDRSGTQYAIRFCIEQKKPLFVLENNIHEPEYDWVKRHRSHIKLIKYN